MENKGKVQFKLTDIKFDLFSLDKDNSVNQSKEYGGQTQFPNKIIEGNYKPSRAKLFFIGPNVKAKYSFITSIPDSAHMVILHNNFEYSDRKRANHTSEKTIMLSDEKM